ncbi:hypothetical protein SERLA73DRAFT_67899 [Serpula lacrymans var. lacrymans S7.3]|uniref:Uncharacterized protein n=2 Tax=Serpula lacrymans var. lacrymans TaxID=341189 RepID=F8PF80_SERL3|nr:uncharacterized protein SERLADRAFT_431602 [Serpula lacrymans var. lacrymans S7.9]EGO04186.1 hypothetical protein SERLA73DRAFT_67899 [Serpula lacrymans var. lacrymans S7.3]EGO30130.1 hypothetical protein SERLADRAFT_431602 [Serpula lacrymans var. lacrymans S7.9]
MTHGWTQHNADSCCLVEEITSIAYDADTGRYTFRDRLGHLHESAPHAEHRGLAPVSSRIFPYRRVTTEQRNSNLHAKFKFTTGQPETFNDILPSAFAASPLYVDRSPKGTGSHFSASAKNPTKGRFTDALAKSTVPAMQNAMEGVMKWLKSVANRRRIMTGRVTDEKSFLLSLDESIHKSDAEKLIVDIVLRYGSPPPCAGVLRR